jgi:cytochrome c oxidase cbb3-type subunit 4
MEDSLPETAQSVLMNPHVWSLVVVTITFLLIVAYALWPSMQKDFDEAARLPLEED